MSYWTNMEQEGAPKSAVGWHRYTVKKALRCKKSGEEFVSKNGDPQFLVVLVDEAGDEATDMFTLSEKAGWKLAKFLSRAGIDLGALDEEGVTLESWEDERFAEERLVGRKAWAYCTHDQSRGKTYANLEFYHEDEVPPSALGVAKESADDGSPPIDDSDIPFAFPLWIGWLAPLAGLLAGGWVA